MKKLIYLLPFVLLCWAYQLEAQTKNALFPIPNAQGKWGYVDANNKIVIPHKFESASPFYEERALVAQKQANGQVACKAINTRGDILFEINFLENQIDKLYHSHYHRYSNGLMNIPNYGSESKIHQYIDKAGKIALTFTHNSANGATAHNFSEGLAYVQLTNSTLGYIDTKGKTILQSNAGDLPIEHDFQQGWAVTTDSIGYGYTYINKKGERATFLSKYTIQDLGSMQEGYAFMALAPKDSTQQEPNFVILQPDYSIKPITIKLSHSTPVTYVSGYHFSNGLAYVRYMGNNDLEYDDNFGYINTSGKLAFKLPKELIPTIKGDNRDFYVTGCDFHEGLACWAVTYPNNTTKIVYINTLGMVVLESPIFKN